MSEEIDRLRIAVEAGIIAQLPKPELVGKAEHTPPMNGRLATLAVIRAGLVASIRVIEKSKVKPENLLVLLNEAATMLLDLHGKTDAELDAIEAKLNDVLSRANGIAKP